MNRLPEDTNWAVTEFADTDLGDERRTIRLVELAHALAQHPTATLPEACGSGAMLKGAYRFFSLRPLGSGPRGLGGARYHCMGDREADVYDLLVAPRPEGVELLVRAAWDRRVHGPERYVWATVEAQPVMAQLLLHVPRRGVHPARAATLELRWGRLTLCPPRHRKKAEGLPEVTLWVVHVREIAPPAEVTPLEWLLLTTVTVQSVDDASERVAWYACRWGILRSGIAF